MKSVFHNLYQLSKRIVVIALAASAVLLSGSVFVVTASRSFAREKPASSGQPLIGLGCDDSNVYYFDSQYKLKRRPKSTAKYDT